jgi:hypothetical protein
MTVLKSFAVSGASRQVTAAAAALSIAFCH